MMMMFSRVGRSTISRSRNVLIGGNGGRSTGSSVYQSRRYIGHANDINKLGFVKRYLGSLPPTNTQKHLFPNPGVPRFFYSTESEAPKNKYDDKFHLKKFKKFFEGNNQNFGYEEESSTDGKAGPVLARNAVLLALAAYLTEHPLRPLRPGEQKEISFQDFKNELLEQRLVDHIVISNKSVAKVYVKNSPRKQSTHEGSSPAKVDTSQYKYYIKIPIVESFMKKLKKAQEAMGIDTRHYVPVTYASDKSWYQEIRQTAFIWLVMDAWYMVRNMQGRLGAGHAWFGLAWVFCLITWVYDV